MSSKSSRPDDSRAGPSARSATPPVSVVIPARDAHGTLAATLESVSAQDYSGDIEVIVADGSLDVEVITDLIRCQFPGVKVVRNPAGPHRAH